MKIIIQARMTSTRLPGKILKSVFGKALLEFQIERLRQISSHPEIWIATTTNREDDVTVSLAEKLEVPVFRGSESDVLGRYYGCALVAKAQSIVRVTADCPLIDPDIIESIVQLFIQNPSSYVQNVVDRTFPRGLDTEIFSFDALEDAYKNATQVSDREHVTPYIRRKYPAVTYRSASKNFSNHRWTVDTPADFDLIRRILEEVYPSYPRFRISDVLAAFERHPDWYAINADVEQKKD